MDTWYNVVEAGGVDPVTSFGDREALFTDLANALEEDSPPRVLGVFDLAGLEDYRKISGLVAADQLVLRLARRFADVLGPKARCYRSRSDEFWTLIDGSLDVARPLLDAALRAVRDEGRAAEVAASFGVAFLPEEADEPMEALMIADRELGAARRARERRKMPRN